MYLDIRFALGGKQDGWISLESVHVYLALCW